MMPTEQILFEKIKVLPPQKLAEVIDFVDFSTQREEQKLIQSATKFSENSFAKVWENDEDDLYN